MRCRSRAREALGGGVGAAAVVGEAMLDFGDGVGEREQVTGDELVVGTGPTGSPVDFIVFHTTRAYVSINANGATPRSLTALARQVYPLVR